MLNDPHYSVFPKFFRRAQIGPVAFSVLVILCALNGHATDGKKLRLWRDSQSQ